MDLYCKIFRLADPPLTTLGLAGWLWDRKEDRKFQGQGIDGWMDGWVQKKEGRFSDGGHDRPRGAGATKDRAG